MKYRKLGRTNIKVSEIGFGAWAVGGNWGGGHHLSNGDDEFIIGCRIAVG
jgi:aryl-alcohol dehydrogenase-like predicted oxidoreductase